LRKPGHRTLAEYIRFFEALAEEYGKDTPIDVSTSLPLGDALVHIPAPYSNSMTADEFWLWDFQQNEKLIEYDWRN
jgi:FAD/FMN-containing dehydrogenase